MNIELDRNEVKFILDSITEYNEYNSKTDKLWGKINKQYENQNKIKNYKVKAKIGIISTKYKNNKNDCLFIRLPKYIAINLDLQNGDFIEFNTKNPKQIEVIKNRK
jgi:hypothetical protein